MVILKKQYYEHNRAADRVPSLEPSIRCAELVQWFWNIRSLAGDIEKPISMGVIEGWQRHRAITLHRWERDCIFVMDRALRNSYSNVVKWHAARKQIKTDSGKDWGKAHG